jgi:hypothetical protein
MKPGRMPLGGIPVSAQPKRFCRGIGMSAPRLIENASTQPIPHACMIDFKPF